MTETSNEAKAANQPGRPIGPRNGRNGAGHARKEGCLLTPAEVAELFHVDRKTAVRWATTGKLSHERTPAATFASTNPRCTRCWLPYGNRQ